MSFRYFFTACLWAVLLTGASTVAARPAKADIKTEEVTYADNGTKCKGFVAYDAARKGPLPVVLVVHEWWGCNDYARMRARKLAELGYFALAVDMYGDGQRGDDPQAAQTLATPFYQNPQLAVSRLEAAITKVKTYKQADATRIAAIGYCFGGSMVLNAAKLGMELKGVVSFHGGLQGVDAEAGKTKSKILVCHGAADVFIPQAELDAFRKDLDEAGAPYTFVAYADATHAFTNPGATETGKKFSLPIAYNEAADKASWKAMKSFLKKVLK